MSTYTAHQVVPPGLYFDIRQLYFQNVEERSELQGSVGEKFHRIPMVAMLVIGPIIGLAYVVFLPLIGFVAIGWLAGTKIAELFRRGRNRLAERRARRARHARRTRPSDPSGSHNAPRKAA